MIDWMAVPSASTTLPSVAQVEEVVVVAEATTLEAEEGTVEVDMVCVGVAYPHTRADMHRRRWRRLWWWT